MEINDGDQTNKKSAKQIYLQSLNFIDEKSSFFKVDLLANNQ